MMTNQKIIQCLTEAGYRHCRDETALTMLTTGIDSTIFLSDHQALVVASHSSMCEIYSELIKSIIVADGYTQETEGIFEGISFKLSENSMIINTYDQVNVFNDATHEHNPFLYGLVPENRSGPRGALEIVIKNDFRGAESLTHGRKAKS